MLISDGITDQIGEATGRAYGRKRFREVLVANAGVPLDILKAAVFDNLHGHQGTQVRRDNVTLIAFQPQ